MGRGFKAMAMVAGLAVLPGTATAEQLRNIKPEVSPVVFNAHNTQVTLGSTAVSSLASASPRERICSDKLTGKDDSRGTNLSTLIFVDTFPESKKARIQWSSDLVPRVCRGLVAGHSRFVEYQELTIFNEIEPKSSSVKFGPKAVRPASNFGINVRGNFAWHEEANSLELVRDIVKFHSGAVIQRCAVELEEYASVKLPVRRDIKCADMRILPREVIAGRLSVFKTSK